jgi:DNA-binding beta-propeller fold protein YncE
MARLRATSALALAIALAAPGATARKAMPHDFDDDDGPIPRNPNLFDPRISKPMPPGAAQPAQLAGGSIAAVGDGAIVLDPDSGALIRVDGAGKPLARVAIGRDGGQLVFDPERSRAYVADRRGDRIVVVAVAADSLTAAAEWKTRAEPVGLALSPNGRTLLVTTAADRQLSALDTGSGAERWTRDAGADPRGVAISPDGSLAAVTSLSSGVVTFYDAATGAPAAHAALAPALASARVTAREGQGRSFARNAFAVAFVGERSIVVPHQLSTPDMAGSESRGSYGGSSFQPPVAHRITFVDAPRDGLVSAPRARTEALHQPRAVAYDRGRDTLYVAGFGDDRILALVDASQPSARVAWTTTVTSVNADSACGPSGLAVAPSGAVLAWCELGRRVAVVAPTEARIAAVAVGPELAPSRYSKLEQEGRALFFDGENRALSTRGALACASCHPEGRADGLSWRIEGSSLQTPVLAGRTVGSHPFKWDGKDATIEISLTNTVKRLGGTGITKAQARALDAFLATLAPPRAPTPRDAHAVARGRALFQSADAGCASCHAGAQLADGKRHDLADDLPNVDTPSLLGLAQSAPYYHDGSAATLRAVLHGNASVHGMGRTAHLSQAQIDDLVSYLETL